MLSFMKDMLAMVALTSFTGAVARLDGYGEPFRLVLWIEWTERLALASPGRVGPVSRE